jgi:uncharacterized protein (DUF1800 family)
VINRDPLHLTVPALIAWLGAIVAMAGCAALPSKPAADVTRADVVWLNRITYGVNSELLGEYRKLGQTAFLNTQLVPADPQLPTAVANQIAALEISHTDLANLVATMSADNKGVNAMQDGPDKERARKEINDHGNKLAYEATRRNLLRAIYSPAQLQEQMVWFWLNHFSVQQYKANIRWSIADYEEHAIRPHVFGRFRDLVMATLTHPAMLQYLDNAQNSLGHINENYARELMELHTLGVNTGYTQQDVQELARVLTGAGVNFGSDPPKLKPEWQPLYRHTMAFEFNPARHDFGTKTLLGQTIRGRGFDEIEAAVNLLIKQPSCGRFISRKLAIYFVSDNPPPALIERMAKTFQSTDGEIDSVLRVMFSSREFADSLSTKFKDPMHFVVSATRLAYDGRLIANTHPIVNWLNGLGEALYGRPTPDGYPLTETGWASSGQMSRRFEIARAIGSGNAGLFEPEDGSAAQTTGFPQIASRTYFAAIEPLLAKQSREALARANSQQEWNTFILASPEFNYR